MTSPDGIVEFDLRELGDIVKEYQQRGGNLAEINPVVAEGLVDRVIDNFLNEEGFQQGPWQEMAESTKRARDRKGSSDYTLLRDTGVLFGSIQPYADDEVAEAYTNNPNAKWHTSPKPRFKIPLRDFTDIDLESAASEAAELMLMEVLT